MNFDWFKTGALVKMDIPGYQGPGCNGEKMTLVVTSVELGRGYVTMTDGSKRSVGITSMDIKPWNNLVDQMTK